MRRLSFRLGTGVLALFLAACGGGKPEVGGSEDTGGKSGSGGRTSVTDGGDGVGGGIIIGGGGLMGSGGGSGSGGEQTDACSNCTPTDVCSDGKITGNEQCDDGNGVQV